MVRPIKRVQQISQLCFEEFGNRFALFFVQTAFFKINAIWITHSTEKRLIRRYPIARGATQRIGRFRMRCLPMTANSKQYLSYFGFLTGRWRSGLPPTVCQGLCGRLFWEKRNSQHRRQRFWAHLAATSTDTGLMLPLRGIRLCAVPCRVYGITARR